jgi:hypothetical protein
LSQPSNLFGEIDHGENSQDDKENDKEEGRRARDPVACSIATAPDAIVPIPPASTFNRRALSTRT